jgi:la-related protein 1
VTFLQIPQRKLLEIIKDILSELLFKTVRVVTENALQQLALWDLKKGHLYGVEKMWAYLKYRKEKSPLKIASELTDFLAKVKNVKQFADPKFAPSPVEGHETLAAPPSSIPVVKQKKGSKQRQDSAGSSRPRSGSSSRPRSGSNSSTRSRGGSGTFQRPRAGSNAARADGSGSSLKKGSSPSKPVVPPSAD